MSRKKFYRNLNLGQAESNDDFFQLGELINYAQAENISVKNVLIHQQHLKRLFIKLLGIGLVTGIFAAMAVVVTIQKFGLTEKINGNNESQLQKRVKGNQTEVRFLDANETKIFRL